MIFVVRKFYRFFRSFFWNSAKPVLALPNWARIHRMGASLQGSRTVFLMRGSIYPFLPASN